MSLKQEQRSSRARGAAILAGLVLTVGATVFAQVPQLISYQGKLLDGSGSPVADGSYAMEFRFYDACSGGNLLLTDSHAAVPTTDGIYSVLLGSGTITPGVEPDLLSVFQSHSTVCLGLKVGTDSEMTPRQQIVSSGFALRAVTADSSVSDTSGAFNKVNSLVNTLIIANDTGSIIRDGVANSSHDPATGTVAELEGKLVPGGAVYDDYEDGIFDAGLQTVSFGGDAPNQTHTTDESSGRLLVENLAPNPAASVVIVTTELNVSHDFSLSAGQAVFRIDFEAHAGGVGGGGALCNEQVRFRYGGVELAGGCGVGSFTVSRGEYYVILNAGRTVASVYLDGAFQQDVDITAATDGRFTIFASTRDPGDPVQASILVYQANYLDDGLSYTEVAIFDDGVALDPAIQEILVRIDDTVFGSTTRAIQVSFDGGSTYVPVQPETITEIVTANSTLKVRVQYSIAGTGDWFELEVLGYIYG